MAGESLTKEFMLATATVMVGPQADLYNLAVDTHSIGLVKNFQISSEPEYTELTQGVKNSIVDSQMTSNPVRANMEVYEYTSKNMKYALGLDGSGLTSGTSGALKTALSGGETTFDITVASDLSAEYVVGAWVQVQEGDNVHLSPIVSASFSVDTITVVISRAVPVGQAFTTAAKCYPVNSTDIGSKEDQPYLCAKVVAVMPNTNGETVTLLIPSLRVTKGFNLAFSTEYGNMPWEFTIYDPVTTDPFYADIKVPVKLMKR